MFCVFWFREQRGVSRQALKKLTHDSQCHLVKDREVPAFAGMTTLRGEHGEIPAFAGIVVRNRILSKMTQWLIFFFYISQVVDFWEMKEYFVYMLSNKYHNVLYVGVTNNIRRRVYEHKRKLVYGFTSKYNCCNLVWYEKFTDVNLAITRETQIKTWKRSWKDNIIEKGNPNWIDLASEWFVKGNN